MLGRIVRSADFARALAAPPTTRSAHFAAHHLTGAPSTAPARAIQSKAQELSTANSEPCAQPVDESAPARPVGHIWLGVSVPKRHAREATTRNLIKRQIRAAMRRHEAQLAGGLWLVRLRSAFDRKRFVSSTSGQLRAAARQELDGLLQRAGQ